ncbi:hypothetical protein BD311DRAFT_803755 [Dichomitus squalens]|uniref:Uncharacterized protein n=1 Tax=Dichomitus squalens TaxID=114155 RepID=A0A4Q9N0F4_9APHY|nr:hypothetical protein BD311DRAFT_803755 [Dichomitus squalens]
MNSCWQEPFFSLVLADGTVWTDLDTDDRKALQTCCAALNNLLDWEEPLLRRLGESLRIAGRKTLQTNETVLLLEICTQKRKFPKQSLTLLIERTKATFTIDFEPLGQEQVFPAPPTVNPAVIYETPPSTPRVPLTWMEAVTQGLRRRNVPKKP